MINKIEAVEIPMYLLQGPAGTVHVIAFGDSFDEMSDLPVLEEELTSDNEIDLFETDAEFSSSFDLHRAGILGGLTKEWYEVRLTIREDRHGRRRLGRPPAHPAKSHK